MSRISWVLGDAPSGRKLDNGEDANVIGTFDLDGLDATEERLALARRIWTERDANEFEQTGKCRWTDGEGVEHVWLRGSPIHGISGQAARLTWRALHFARDGMSATTSGGVAGYRIATCRRPASARSSPGVAIPRLARFVDERSP